MNPSQAGGEKVKRKKGGGRAREEMMEVGEQKDRNKGQRNKVGKKGRPEIAREKGAALKRVASPVCQAGSRQPVSQSVIQSPWLQQDRCPGFDLHMLFRAWSPISLFFFYCF